MKRWFVTLMVLNEDGERSPKVAPYTNPQDPTAPRLKVYSNDASDMCIGVAVFPNLSEVGQDSGVFILDEVTLGSQWSTLPQVRRNEIAAAIRSFGFTFDVHATWSMKQVIQHVVHQVQPGADIESADIFDPYG